MLGVRLDPETERRLEALARRERRSKSAIVREVVAKAVRARDEAYLAEARRQSIEASRRENPEDYAFWEAIEAEDGDWK